MTLGFVVGKFYPPHRGHKHLIDTARRQVDQLVVLLPHHPSQRIPGELRKAWLEEIHPDCDVRLVPDTLEADDTAAWARFTIDHLGGRAPDVVFSSEQYGPRFAACMNCRHVMVDRDRSAVPISGTRVRRSPLEHLDFLEPCVRSYFVRRVVLIGAESTGKTTLAQRLSERFGTIWVPEYGREYWARKVAGLNVAAGELPPWTSDEFVHIAAEQQRREDAAARSANKVLICDTNAFATGMWHERYARGRCPEVDALGARDKVDLYLLAEPDFPFVQDGLRDGESIRDWMHARFVEELRRLPTPVLRLRGPLEARAATAAAAIGALIRKPFDL
jgi:HTH-type transcriptional regulator, transcriptional repressor of NAD biosynthesis genes